MSWFGIAFLAVMAIQSIVVVMAASANHDVKPCRKGHVCGNSAPFLLQLKMKASVAVEQGQGVTSFDAKALPKMSDELFIGLSVCGGLLVLGLGALLWCCCLRGAKDLGESDPTRQTAQGMYLRRDQGVPWPPEDSMGQVPSPPFPAPGHLGSSRRSPVRQVCSGAC
eukprot:TRINITY_DN104720_c0_g1_i1.p1 TRINITY_DN104720_c0_g1~~TRINITY_DN104720_c0_g1_i1.p1  ORF type:complete len:167 (-),score=22.59 TRINITY_DN104720_c0_g1_i1:179-679(-)